MNCGRISAKKTKTAVINFKSFGLSPATPVPRAGGTARSPSLRQDRQAHQVRPNQRLSNDDARQSSHHHSDSHANIRESLVLRQQSS
jgi:hypothetical protein